MAHEITHTPRNYTFKSGLRKTPWTVAAVVLATWAISAVCLMTLDTDLASLIGWPWSREAIALVMVPAAALTWLLLPRRQVQMVMRSSGLEVIVRRGSHERTHYLGWHDIDGVQIHRAGFWGQRAVLVLRETDAVGQKRTLELVRTTSKSRLPRLLSTMSDYAQSAGYDLTGGVISAFIEVGDRWSVEPVRA